MSLKAPPNIPDEIIVITTTKGAEAIKKELFDSGIWLGLKSFLNIPDNKLCFGMSAKHIRFLPSGNSIKNATDIKSSKDNVSAADYILETLRQFTENPDTKITFSIAGGRKTMSALAALCMSLLGRSDDLLCHVLVNPPFDSPLLSPRFYYPGQKNSHLTVEGTTVYSRNAEINLCKIPFVRLRELFISEKERLPGTFSDTVKLANQALDGAADILTLKIIPKTGECVLCGINVILSIPEFIMYWMLAERKKRKEKFLKGQVALLEEFHKFANKITEERMPATLHYSRSEEKTQDDARKIIASIKRKIALSRILCPDKFNPAFERGIYGINVNPENISIE
jgi:CRISPR-associated protein (TIGR02584 family)